jgi:anti-sigma factor RsiW
MNMPFAIANWLGHRLLPCTEITERLSNAFDRPLSTRERLEIWLHLRICDFCRRYAAQLNFLRDALRRREETVVLRSPPATLPPEARQRMKAAVEAGNR